MISTLRPHRESPTARAARVIVIALSAVLEGSCDAKKPSAPSAVDATSSSASVEVASTRATAAALTTCSEHDAVGCQRACDGGSLDDCLTLGFILIRGDGVPKDVLGARASFKKACDGHLTVACGALGETYFIADGANRDVPRGLALLEETCNGGDSLSCESLGGLYAGGDSSLSNIVPVDLAAARRFYEKGCAIAGPCMMLAGMLADGVGGAKDPVRANQLFARACDAHEALACKILGDDYARGASVTQDAQRATELYDEACRLGYARACPSPESRRPAKP